MGVSKTQALSSQPIQVGRGYSAVAVEGANIADPKVLSAIAVECGLPSQRVEQSQRQDVQERYEAFTQEAIDAQVFGAPTYAIDGELFWGQDRLHFVERALQGQTN